MATIEHRVISSVVGWRKPAPQFFAALAETLQISVNEILMVGDDINNDILGAVEAGMSAVWVCRSGETDAELPPNSWRVSSLTELAQLLTDGETKAPTSTAESRRG